MNNVYSATWEHENHTALEAVIWKIQDIRDNWIAYLPAATLITVFVLAGLLG